MMDRHIDRFWERMTKIYGHKWVSGYGIADDGTWLAGLHDVSLEQIGQGLEKCRVSSEPWPPTLPEFRTMCIGQRAHVENAGAYRQYAALPKPPADKGKAQSQLAAMREKLG
ncbi:MAG: hypothetical protein K6U74_09570 [Firmicutes bacterium]|nr:hypothetical protein [Bacillota bacterium]